MQGRKKLHFCAVVVKIILLSISLKHGSISCFPPDYKYKIHETSLLYVHHIFFLSHRCKWMSSDTLLSDLQRKYCIMENMVFHTKQEVLLCFQFWTFFNGIINISSWSICRRVLCYFSISNSSPLKHLNESFGFPLQSASGTLAEYLSWSKNRFSP